MGSWSVNCGISNIAITSGNNCVLLPLKKSKSHNYRQYQIATLPIFGQYNDYGGIEEIVEDENTKYIESYFGITIEEFCVFLVDGKFTYNRGEAKEVQAKLEENGKFDEIKDWRFMWIDKQVYDAMCENNNTWYKGHNHYGTEFMLKKLGFTFVEKSDKNKNYDPKRFNQVWTKGDFKVFSDGTNILIKDRYVYNFGNNDENSLETYMEVPEELQVLKSLSTAEAWRYIDPKSYMELFYDVLGDRYDFDSINMLKLLDKIHGKKTPKKFYEYYLENLEFFGDTLAKFNNIFHNLHAMSHELLPHTLYLTPQCGEYRIHQILLEKFTAINKSYCQNEDED